jgi:hypothetical protein
MRLSALAATFIVLYVPSTAAADTLRVEKTATPPVSSLTADDFPKPPGVPIKPVSATHAKKWGPAKIRVARR